jgi:hypothetical protein
MIRSWLVAGSLILLTIGVLLWRKETAPSPNASPLLAPAPLAAPTMRKADPLHATKQSYSSISLSALNDPAVAPEKKVRRVYELVQNYSMVMKSRSRIPLSTNAEITQALTGKNILGEVFIPSDHASISAAGELLDAWQTPYFFHALGADSWEVVSAGPDRIQFNADDLIFPPSQNPSSLRPVGRSGK